MAWSIRTHWSGTRDPLLLSSVGQLLTVFLCVVYVLPERQATDSLGLPYLGAAVVVVGVPVLLALLDRRRTVAPEAAQLAAMPGTSLHVIGQAGELSRLAKRVGALRAAPGAFRLGVPYEQQQLLFVVTCGLFPFAYLGLRVPGEYLRLIMLGCLLFVLVGLVLRQERYRVEDAQIVHERRVAGRVVSRTVCSLAGAVITLDFARQSFSIEGKGGSLVIHGGELLCPHAFAAHLTRAVVALSSETAATEDVNGQREPN